MFSQLFHQITCMEKCLKFVGKLYIVQQTRLRAHCYWSGSVFINLISFTGFKHMLSLKLCDFWRFFREMFTNFWDAYMFQNFTNKLFLLPQLVFSTNTNYVQKYRNFGLILNNFVCHFYRMWFPLTLRAESKLLL